MEKSSKNDIEQIFKKSNSAHREGKLSEAEKGYQEILKRRPDWGQALNALGKLFLDQDRPDKAKTIFEKAANLNPSDLSACYSLGRLKQLENDHQGAIIIYKAMLDQQPNAGIVWNNLGVAYREIGKPVDAIASFRAAVKFAPQMAEAWNNLGVAQDELNLTENALNSYRKSIEIQPVYASPHLNLGISLQKSKLFKEAQEHYNKVLEIQPDNRVARFMLQSIGGAEETPDAAPVEHVRDIFDQCAENFETILVEKLAYKTPELLFNLVRPYLTEKMTILDLGCGTGLGAQLYQPFSKSLTGVDVSSKMLKKAYEKKIYNRLEVFDILQDWVFPEKFDLIYSSDVFVYFGNLDTIIRSASSYLVDEGKIAFSVEKLKDSSAYQLFPSGRYAHSQEYIQECLNRHGLQLIEIKEADVRNQSGNPVKGLLIVAKK
jgi:predicted TPR repeat methyltransferase